MALVKDKNFNSTWYNYKILKSRHDRFSQLISIPLGTIISHYKYTQLQLVTLFQFHLVQL